MPNQTQTNQQKTTDYGGGGIHATSNGHTRPDLTEGPAGMGSRCDNFRRVNGPDAPLSLCPDKAQWRIVYLNGDKSKTVKRCSACAQRLRVSRNLVKCEELL